MSFKFNGYMDIVDVAKRTADENGEQTVKGKKINQSRLSLIIAERMEVSIDEI